MWYCDIIVSKKFRFAYLHGFTRSDVLRFILSVTDPTKVHFRVSLVLCRRKGEKILADRPKTIVMWIWGISYNEVIDNNHIKRL